MTKKLEDVFASDEELDISEEVVRDFYTRKAKFNKEKSALDKINKMIKKTLLESGKHVARFGNIVVKISIPDTSKFNMDKVLEYVKKNHPDMVHKLTKQVIDEDALDFAIDTGLIDTVELSKFALERSLGTPRATLKEVEDD